MADKKPFESQDVLVVAKDDAIRRALTRVFTNCGATVYCERDGHEALKQQRKLRCRVIVFCNDIQRGGAQWFAHQLRVKNIADSDVLWYIGDKPITYMDGYTSRPFKPVVLVKAIAYNLAVVDDLKKAE
ncbi:MAG: hypothetical protein HRU19_18855 [Pseudobacteriovorax sp.]|nr:hypothetical protein [Pseudobacteriovorax sp.]